MIKLSATLHKKEEIDQVIYYYGLRQAINNNYLCDYKILCKIFKKEEQNDNRFY